MRGDRGGDNVDVMNYMRSGQVYLEAYIQGPSLHNKRIERLHYDTNHAVLSYSWIFFYGRGGNFQSQ